MVIVIAATNEPWAVDRGFLRPGRLERTIYIGTMSETGRREMLLNLIREIIPEEGQYVDADVALDDLMALTEGFTGADMKFLVRSVCIDLQLETTISRSGFFCKCADIIRRGGLQASTVSPARQKMFDQWVGISNTS